MRNGMAWREGTETRDLVAAGIAADLRQLPGEVRLPPRREAPDRPAPRLQPSADHGTEHRMRMWEAEGVQQGDVHDGEGDPPDQRRREAVVRREGGQKREGGLGDVAAPGVEGEVLPLVGVQRAGERLPGPRD